MVSLVLPALPNRGGPDKSSLPPGVKVTRATASLDGQTYACTIDGPPGVLAGILLEAESNPYALAIKALLDPMIEQANQIAERAGHQDLARDPGQIADDARRSLEKGGGKDPGPGDTKTPPKEIDRG